jgi:hypothetical protein
MIRLFSAMTVLWMAVAGGASAQNNPIVIELYTSQGCSSCPPADALLHDLAKRGDVIALALHVDYWDYIGWKDEFADPAFTKRQKAYARAAGHRTVYTPQMIIGGLDHVIGNRPMEVADAIQAHKGQQTGVSVQAQRSGSTLTIQASTTQPSTEKLLVQLVRFTPKQTVAITRGENAGKTLSYANVVSSWQILDTWNARRPLDMKVNSVGSGPLAVIIQRQGNKRILAAAQVN